MSRLQKETAAQVGEIRMSADVVAAYNQTWWLPSLFAAHIRLKALNDASTILFLGPGTECAEALHMRVLTGLLKIHPKIYAVGDEQVSRVGKEVLAASTTTFFRGDYIYQKQKILERIGSFPSVVIARNPPLVNEMVGGVGPISFPEHARAMAAWAREASSYGSQFLLSAHHIGAKPLCDEAFKAAGVSCAFEENRLYFNHPDPGVRSMLETDEVTQQYAAKGIWPDHVTVVAG